MEQADIDRRLKLIGDDRPSACPLDCPLHPRSPMHNPMLSGGYVPPFIPSRAKLLVVGIVPGEEEELGGESFIGPSGRYAAHAIQWANGGKPLVYAKINIVNCRTVKPGKTRSFINRTPPTAREMMECYHAHLRPLLKRRKWACVALFGSDVYRFLIPEIETAPRQYMKLFDVFGKAMGHRCTFDPEQYPEWFGGEDDDIPF